MAAHTAASQEAEREEHTPLLSSFLHPTQHRIPARESRHIQLSWVSPHNSRPPKKIPDRHMKRLIHRRLLSLIKLKIEINHHGIQSLFQLKKIHGNYCS